MNDVPKELLDRLDALAEKLGATGEYLWRELVWYTRVTYAAEALIGFVCLVVFFVIGLHAVKRWRKVRMELPADISSGDAFDKCAPYFVPAAICAVLTTIAFGSLIITAAWFLSAEGATLRTLLGR